MNIIALAQESKFNRTAEPRRIGSPVRDHMEGRERVSFGHEERRSPTRVHALHVDPCDGGSRTTSISLDASDRRHLEKILARLKAVRGVHEVVRKFQVPEANPSTS